MFGEVLRLVEKYRLPPYLDCKRLHCLTSSFTTSLSKWYGCVAFPMSTAMMGLSNDSSLGAQTLAALLTDLASVLMSGRARLMTCGRSGKRYWGGVMTRSNRSIQRRGLPISTSLVAGDCFFIHKAAMACRRPAVITRSGQGGERLSELFGSRCSSDALKRGLPSMYSCRGSRCLTLHASPRLSPIMATWALSPSLSPSNSQIRGKPALSPRAVSAVLSTSDAGSAGCEAVNEIYRVGKDPRKVPR